MQKLIHSIRAHSVHSLCLVFAVCCPSLQSQTDSLPPLKDGKSPETVAAAWEGYDPSVEPIEAEVIKEWQEDGVILRAVRYCIGTFKGQKSWMGALYAFPAGAKDLPAIVQIHGGGGMGSTKPCIENAKRGYATISLSWRADERYLEKYELPETAQTDWGAVEGRQVAESRGIEPDNDKRYDPFPSARNSGYFLRALAARRALTFLEQQEEVDGERLGVDGYSMGGVITFMTAAMDERVKAASPWWAPPLILDGSLKGRTASPNAYAEHIQVPLMIMSPTNDFHGTVEAVAWMVDHMPDPDVRISRAVHLNHKNDAGSVAARELWFDSKLKDGHTFPGQPEIKVELNTSDKRPQVTVTPDASMPFTRVEVFYTRDGNLDDYSVVRTRFWQYAEGEQQGKDYQGQLDLFDLEEPLFVFANVYYEVSGAGDVAPVTDKTNTFTVTTRLVQFSPEELAEAGVSAHGKTTQVIESFGGEWEREWLVSDRKWSSYKLNHSQLVLPPYAKMVLELKSEEDNQLTVQVGDYRGTFPVEGGASKQTIEIYPFDLTEKKTKAKLLKWSALNRPLLVLGTSRSKPEPVFQDLRWKEITQKEFMAERPFQLGDAEKEDGQVMLTFGMADHVDGRHELDNSSFRVHESNQGVDVSQGLQVHSQDVSEVTYFLKGEFSKFTATLVPCYQASVVFEVHGDGEKLFESDVIRGQTQPQDIEVDVSGVQQLKLVVSEGGNGWGGDSVMWSKAALSTL